jgi:hypothetical protein
MRGRSTREPTPSPIARRENNPSYAGPFLGAQEESERKQKAADGLVSYLDAEGGVFPEAALCLWAL